MKDDWQFWTAFLCCWIIATCWYIEVGDNVKCHANIANLEKQILHPPSKIFVSSVPQDEQPNCVVGAYIMYAKETLNVELLKDRLQTQYPTLTNVAVHVSVIPVIWDDIFYTNPLKCIYNIANVESLTNRIDLNKPYIWTGNWSDNTNGVYHTCLVYLTNRSVIFKHFVLDPATQTNYMVQTNYEFFFNRTIRLYTLK
jgi:hypothetical protein